MRVNLLPTARSRTLPHGHGRAPAYRRLPSASSRRAGGPISSTSSARSPSLFYYTHARPPPHFLHQSQLRLATFHNQLSSSLTPSRSLTSTAVRWHSQRGNPDTGARNPQSGECAEPTFSADGNHAEQVNRENNKERDNKSRDEGDQDEGKHGENDQDAKTDSGEKKQKEQEDVPPPPHGDKTPWQVFVETMRTEFQQSQEWNESTKALAAGAQQFTESESVQRARKAYEATSGAVSSTASTVLKTTAGVVGKGASWTWDTSVVKGVRAGASLTGEALDKATKPIRETEAFKHVKNVIDDGSSSRYGGWIDREERRRRRETQENSSAKPPEFFQENPEAGTNITIHKDAAWKDAWREFRDCNPVAQGFFNMKTVYNESDNPLITTARSITDRVAGFFAENESAQVIKKLRSMDPTFQLEPFLRDLREYMLPEVLDAYVKGDVETLKLWLSEAQYSVYEALTKQYMQAGLRSDGRILDIRHVDILKARMLEPGEIPVFVITCRTQEVHVYRKAKSNELAAGMEDRVQLVTYAIGMTRIPEDVNNPETRGWRLIEMQKSGRDYI